MRKTYLYMFIVTLLALVIFASMYQPARQPDQPVHHRILFC